MNQATKTDSMLPAFMQENSSNPLFAPNAGQNYANQYYQQAIVPQLANQSEQEWLGGNEGTSGNSSFGADYLGNMAATGANQSFFAGQQNLNQQIQNMLGERQSYFGNDVATNQTQDNLASQLGMQAQTTNAANSLNSQEFNNSYDLNQGNSAANQENTQYQQQLQYNAANAQNMTGLMTGGLSTALGGLFAAPSLYSGYQSSGLGSALGNMFGSSGSAGSAGAGASGQLMGDMTAPFMGF